MWKMIHNATCAKCGKSGPGNYWTRILAPGDEPTDVLAAPVQCDACHAAERCPDCGQTAESGHLPGCNLKD